MTVVGGGGVRVSAVRPSRKFEKDFSKLDLQMQNLALAKLKALLLHPFPPGLRFEKLKGYKRPDIYTIHVTGNYKISFEIDGTTATLRRIGPHDFIDRAP